MGIRTHRASFAAVVATMASLLPTGDAAGQATVSVQWTYPVETVFVADFAPYNVGQQPDFLGITLVNGAPRSQSVRLFLEVRMERPQSVVLFSGNTGTFTLDGTVRRITNRDLADRASDVVIEDFEIGDEADDLTDRMQQTGRFPSGTYLFRVALKTPSGAPLANGEVRVDLVNPTRLELVGPGSAFGDLPERVTSPSPRFVWSSDDGVAGGLGTYRLRVVPVGAAASPDEAMQGFASWETTTSASSAIYPGSASAIPLAPGQIYAWQVTREVRTSGGTSEIASPIYWFKMSGGDDPAGRTDLTGGRIGVDLTLLQLGAQLGLGGELSGFHPVGQVLVDGKPVSFENLEALIRAILSGQVTLRQVSVQ